MESIFRSIDVSAPVSEVYDRWTHVEDYPLFMHHLLSVTELGDGCFHWRAEHNGIQHESVEEISLKIPNKRIAWRNVSGNENSGLVSFEDLGDSLTRVTLELAYEPDSGWHEPAALGGRIEGTLHAFQEMMEPGLVEELVAHNWRGF